MLNYVKKLKIFEWLLYWFDIEILFWNDIKYNVINIVLYLKH